jgi:hypothetical protein
VFGAVLVDISRQPAAMSVQTGRDTYTYALDNIGGDRVAAASLFQDVAQSELGLIYVKGDTSQGGTLAFENRSSRALTTTNLSTLDNTMRELAVPRTLDNVFNRAEVVIASRTVDPAATTVLFSLSQPQAASISPGETVVIWGDFRDPNSKANWVGGTAMVAPAVTTDYTMNGSADGSGADLSASFAVVATFFGSTVKFSVANNHATANGYITKLQCRGKGLYRYDAETLRGDSASSQTAYGLRPLTFPMPYQDSHATAQGAADYLVNLYGSPVQQVNSVTFDANRSSTLMTAALAREVSDRVGLLETVTGVTTDAGLGLTRGWYINSVEMEIQPSRVGPRLAVTWGLAPADAQQYWILDQVGSSELDITTRPGYA